MDRRTKERVEGLGLGIKQHWTAGVTADTDPSPVCAGQCTSIRTTSNARSPQIMYGNIFGDAHNIIHNLKHEYSISVQNTR